MLNVPQPLKLPRGRHPGTQLRTSRAYVRGARGRSLPGRGEAPGDDWPGPGFVSGVLRRHRSAEGSPSSRRVGLEHPGSEGRPIIGIPRIAAAGRIRSWAARGTKTGLVLLRGGMRKPFEYHADPPPRPRSKATTPSTPPGRTFGGTSATSTPATCYLTDRLAFTIIGRGA